MSKPLGAGTVYFIIVFALGFALGSLRVLLVEPRIGPLGAVLVEMPIMLAASWVVCRRLIDRLSIAAPGARLAMGAWAFALLMVTEVALSATLFGRPPAVYLQLLLSAAGLIGLATQIAFGVLPFFCKPRAG